jgi:archaemetzincin
MWCTCCRSKNWSPRCLRTCAEAFPGVSECGPRSYPSDSIPPLAYHIERQQYHSSELLQRMQALACADRWRLIGITAVDLYIPILKYVFGRSTNGRPLRHRFIPPSAPGVLRPRPRRRLAQPAPAQRIRSRDRPHLPSPHCQDYPCAMAAAHAVEWIDLRESTFCESCRSQVESGASSSR